MTTLRFKVEQGTHGGVTDIAYLTENEIAETLRDAVLSAVWLDVQVTIGTVTMPTCMWLDPEHWAEEWSKALGVARDDAVDSVAAIIAATITA